ncbi:MAG: aspartate/glutamate racemase family protein [Candidatus Saccharimonadales bacterium]
MNIGVFDSGIGGKSVANSLTQAFPNATIDYVHDAEHMPYGDKTPDEVRMLTDRAIQPLLGCDVIVIACNTATALAIEYLRNTYKHQLFIGLEPMIKPAVTLTKTGVITVCATPGTLTSDRYKNLKERFAQYVTVIEPDCSEWAYMIEHNQIDDQKIRDMVTISHEKNSDVIVLACTHYHWIRERIEDLAGPEITVLDPSEAIAHRVVDILQVTE